jgi:predicted branched-subunit amino acid permease/drug/metabolite transporter (DMT)-like permease
MNQRIAPGATAFALMVLLVRDMGLPAGGDEIRRCRDQPDHAGGVCAPVWAPCWFCLGALARYRIVRARPVLRPGLLAGLLFGLEFVFIFVGVDRTTVSRMVVFLYTAPCFTVLGLHFFVPGERMAWRQWAGVMLAFAGLVLAFIDKASGGDALGDAFGVLAALFWAATTVLIRATSLARVTATKVLLYQLVVSAAVMFPLSWLVGERGIAAVLSAPTLWAMAYQVVVVAFASYLAWFWLLTRYLAGRLLVFSFLTPLFGVWFGMLLMRDQPSLHFLHRCGDGGGRHRAGQSAGAKMNRSRAFSCSACAPSAPAAGCCSIWRDLWRGGAAKRHPALAAMAMSSIVFAGSAQFLLAQLVGAGAPLLLSAGAVGLINLRHALYSASVAPMLAHLPRRWKLLLAYLLTDEAYAAAIPHLLAASAKHRSRRHAHWILFGSGFGLWAGWQVATLGRGGPRRPTAAGLGLDFALPLTFIAIVVPMISSRALLAAALAAGAAAVLLAALPYKLGLFLAALAGLAVGRGA